MDFCSHRWCAHQTANEAGLWRKDSQTASDWVDVVTFGSRHREDLNVY